MLLTGQNFLMNRKRSKFYYLQLRYYRNTMIKVIENKPLIVRINKEKYIFFKPYFLMKMSNGKIYKAVVKNSQLYWNISGFQFSYNQIKSYL
jgi:hypothetical protein